MADAETLDRVGEAEAKPFRLLDLPPEWWTKIVELAVTSKRTLNCKTKSALPIDFGVPPIAWTCRWMRDEALKSYYSRNTFCIEANCSEHVRGVHIVWIRKTMAEGYWGLMRPLLLHSCCIEEEQALRLLREKFPRNMLFQ